MKSVIVIGGGAAGLSAAITAAKYGAKVTVLEADEKCGRKIKLAGNGKCNLASTLDVKGKYNGSDPHFAERVMENSSVVLDEFFNDCGIVTRTVGDGIYPYSEEAASVYRNLLFRADELGVTIKNRQEVISAEKTDDGFNVKTADWNYMADKLIICTGSNASRNECKADGYELASMLGHTITKLYPALTSLVGKDKPYSWDKVRARAGIKLVSSGKEFASSKGQLQLTSDGISGIPAMDVSGRAAKYIDEGNDVTAIIDFLPDKTIDEVKDLFAKNRAGQENLCGILPERLATYICKNFNEELPGILKEFQVEITGTRDFDMSQCTSGGVMTFEIDPRTMQSLCCSDLYLAGEVTDVDGICGGFNLSYAFVSGIIAGRNAAND